MLKYTFWSPFTQAHKQRHNWQSNKAILTSPEQLTNPAAFIEKTIPINSHRNAIYSTESLRNRLKTGSSTFVLNSFFSHLSSLTNRSPWIPTNGLHPSSFWRNIAVGREDGDPRNDRQATETRWWVAGSAGAVLCVCESVNSETQQENPHDNSRKASSTSSTQPGLLSWRIKTPSCFPNAFPRTHCGFPTSSPTECSTETKWKDSSGQVNTHCLLSPKMTAWHRDPHTFTAHRGQQRVSVPQLSPGSQISMLPTEAGPPSTPQHPGVPAPGVSDGCTSPLRCGAVSALLSTGSHHVWMLVCYFL